MDSSFCWLKDFDWSLRMVLSSDKISGLRKPIIQLQLQTSDPSGNQTPTLIELTDEDTTKLLAVLKNAQQAHGSLGV